MPLTILKLKLFIDCGLGSFGADCNETCGHCRDLNQCSNVDGRCLTGCEAGYEGELCKKSKLYLNPTLCTLCGIIKYCRIKVWCIFRTERRNVLV